MSETDADPETDVEADTDELARRAERAALRLANVDEATRNEALRSIADAIRERRGVIERELA